MVVDDSAIIFDILDCAGAEEFVALRDQYYRNCDALIYCDSFEKGDEVEKIREVMETVLRIQDLQRFDQIPIIICRTKADMSLPFKNISKIMRFAKKNRIPVISTSAKTGTNVDLVFRTASRLAFSKSKRFQISMTD